MKTLINMAEAFALSLSLTFSMGQVWLSSILEDPTSEIVSPEITHDVQDVPKVVPAKDGNTVWRYKGKDFPEDTDQPWKLTLTGDNGRQVEAIYIHQPSTNRWRWFSWVKACEPPQDPPQVSNSSGIKTTDWVKVLNVTRRGSQWSYPGRSLPERQRRAYLIRHLLGEVGQPVHRGKFTRSQLEGLNLHQLESLHSNDHEGKPYLRLTVPRSSNFRPAPKPSVVRVQDDFYCPT